MESQDIHGACFGSHVASPNRIRFASNSLYFYNCKGCPQKEMMFISTGLILSHFACKNAEFKEIHPIAQKSLLLTHVFRQLGYSCCPYFGRSQVQSRGMGNMYLVWASPSEWRVLRVEARNGFPAKKWSFAAHFGTQVFFDVWSGNCCRVSVQVHWRDVSTAKPIQNNAGGPDSH